MARTSAKNKIHTENTTTDSLYGSAPITIQSQPASPAPVATEKKTAAVNDTSLVRKTYYYTNDLIKAIGIAATMEGKDKSEIVREILMDSRLKEYMEKIKTL